MLISIGFVIGCITTVFYYQTHEFIIITIFICIASVYFKPFLNLLLGFICAICVVLIHYYVFYQFDTSQLSNKYAHQATLIVEKVISNRSPQYIRVRITKLDTDSYLYFKRPLALVSINTDKVLTEGDEFNAAVHLNKFRSNKNFSVFDNERYAFTQKLIFKGNVLNKEIDLNQRKEHTFLNSYRLFIKNTYYYTQLNWLYYALLTGDKSMMSNADKQLMQSMGLSHLLAISGLHIGLIFGFGFIFTRFILTHTAINFSQTKNLSIIYSAVGFLCAFIYVYLSDFLVSATRALLMLGCYLLLYYLAKQPLRWRSILFALVMVLTINPFTLLNPGLYFSFTAVAIIFAVAKKLVTQNQPLLNKLYALVVVQLALFIGLLPLSVYFFDGISLAGLLLNLIAIPLLALVIMPSLIFITVLSSIINIGELITILDKGLSSCIELLEAIPHGVGWIAVGGSDMLLVICFYLGILILYFSPYKFMVLLPIGTWTFNYLTFDKPLWSLNVFDVGHGLMVLVEKDRHALIYDFGPSYFNRFSRTQSILLPYIKAKHLIVDTAILSHQDNDHAGGLNHFIEAGFKKSLFTFHETNFTGLCLTKRINFKGLHVESFRKRVFNNKNDNSCVIRIADSIHSVLLSGDISAKRESSLIKADYNLKSTVLISPHHGSDTSSSIEFIQKVDPDIVIHSSAYRGKWAFPKKEIVKRYRDQNTAQYITGENGQVSVEFFSDDIKVNTARNAQSYWFLKD